MDTGAWWAMVLGVTESQTQLKQLSSSSMEQLVIPSFIKKNNQMIILKVYFLFSPFLI